MVQVFSLQKYLVSGAPLPLELLGVNGERMGRRRRYLAPLEVEVLRLGPKGVGIADHERGEILVRAAPPGSRVFVQPFKHKRGIHHARRMQMIRPATGAVIPKCQHFGLCGGCVLQEMSLSDQESAKEKMALGEFEHGAKRLLHQFHSTPKIHPIRGADGAYGYRNKVELSFGVARYLSEADHKSGQAIEGRFLGFHAPGRFDRIVDTDRCELISEEMNQVIAAVRQVTLLNDMPPPHNVRTHEGYWRHLILRQGTATGEILVGLVVAPDPKTTEHIARVAMHLKPLMAANGGPIVGLVALENGGLADVATGEQVALYGRPWFIDKLGDLEFKLSINSFFQTSTAGAVLLYDTINEALGNAHGTLLDLYCGVGSIGLYLSNRFDKIIGVEAIAEAVADAQINAIKNGVENATYIAGDLKNVFTEIETSNPDLTIVVDPPRPGLHPSLPAKLSKLKSSVLVYVACNPAALGRDAVMFAELGWRLTDLWSIDLFPQTGHIEMIGRFVRN